MKKMWFSSTQHNSQMTVSPRIAQMKISEGFNSRVLLFPFQVYLSSSKELNSKKKRN